jgi:hypothetical protein
MILVANSALTSPSRGGRDLQATGAANLGRGDVGGCPAPLPKFAVASLGEFRPPLEGEVTGARERTLPPRVGEVA